MSYCQRFKIAFHQEEIPYSTSYDLFSNGITIKINSVDYPKSKEILAELGIEEFNTSKSDKFRFIEVLENKKNKVKHLSKIPTWLIGFVLSLLVSLTTFTVLINLNWGIEKTEIENTTWCIHSLKHKK